MVFKKTLEDNSLADKINNAKDGENVEDTLSKDGIVSKAALNALKGRDVSLVLSIADQNAKWIINGTSVNDVSDDVNLSVTRSSVDTGNISYDKISKLLSKRQAEQIAFGIVISLILLESLKLAYLVLGDRIKQF